MQSMLLRAIPVLLSFSLDFVCSVAGHFFFAVAHCCRFVIIQKFAVRALFLSSFDIEKHAHTIQHTSWHTQYDQLWRCNYTFCSLYRIALIFFLSLLEVSFLSFHFLFVCGVLYVVRNIKPARSFDAFPVYNLRGKNREKMKKKIIERKRETWRRTAPSWRLWKLKIREEKNLKWKCLMIYV